MYSIVVPGRAFEQSLISIEAARSAVHLVLDRLSRSRISAPSLASSARHVGVLASALPAVPTATISPATIPHSDGRMIQPYCRTAVRHHRLRCATAHLAELARAARTRTPRSGPDAHPGSAWTITPSPHEWNQREHEPQERAVTASRTTRSTFKAAAPTRRILH